MKNEPASCSALKLTSKEGNPYWFRTCDYYADLWNNGAHVVSFPLDCEIKLCGRAAAICSKYSVLGVTNNSEDTWLLDGINSEGLTGGLLMLHEGTSVAVAEPEFEGVMGMEMIAFLLSVCADTADVIKAAERIQVLSVPFEGRLEQVSAHYMFTDRYGRTAVLEAADPLHPGQLRVYDKTIGVMTNSPEYQKQMSNLKWFLSQSVELEGSMLDLDGMIITADSDAEHMCQSGTFPASYAPYDRFVRLAVLKALNNCGQDFSDGQMLPLGSGIISSVYEPKNRGVFHYCGFDGDGKPKRRSNGYTQYTVMYDIKKKIMYIQPYDSTAWIKFVLSDCSDSGIVSYRLNHDPMGGVIKSEGNF